MGHLLEGKTALVMGIANKWSIALAIAEAFSREGASLILTYLGEHQKDAIDSLTGNLNVARVLPCDVSKDEDIAALAAALSGTKIDAAVHCLAFANREDLSRPFLETQRQGYLLAHDVSAYSLVAIARALSPLMPEGGSLMTLTYLGATRVVPNYNVMGVAKAALEATVRYLAHDLGPRQIRVNAISAGAVKTTSARGIKDLGSMLNYAAEKAPMRRNTDPAEVGDTAVFLASDLSRGVTANTIFVDAGIQVMA